MTAGLGNNATVDKRARDEGLVDAATHDILHAGRQLRNNQVHATSQSVVPPVIAADIIRVSHLLVSEIYA